MHRFFLSWNVVPSVARRQQRPVLKRDKRNGQGGGRVELATLSPGGFSLGKGEILAGAGRCPAPSSRHYRVRGHGRATAPPAGEGEPGANSAPCRSGGNHRAFLPGRGPTALPAGCARNCTKGKGQETAVAGFVAPCVCPVVHAHASKELVFLSLYLCLKAP